MSHHLYSRPLWSGLRSYQQLMYLVQHRPGRSVFVNAGAPNLSIGPGLISLYMSIPVR